MWTKTIGRSLLSLCAADLGIAKPNDLLILQNVRSPIGIGNVSTTERIMDAHSPVVRGTRARTTGIGTIVIAQVQSIIGAQGLPPDLEEIPQSVGASNSGLDVNDPGLIQRIQRISTAKTIRKISCRIHNPTGQTNRTVGVDPH